MWTCEVTSELIVITKYPIGVDVRSGKDCQIQGQQKVLRKSKDKDLQEHGTHFRLLLGINKLFDALCRWKSDRRERMLCDFQNTKQNQRAI